MDSPGPDDRWSDRRTAWGFTLTLVLAYGGIVALFAASVVDGLASDAGAASGLAVPLPVAVAGTVLFVALGVGVLMLRPWEADRDDD